MYFLNLLEKIRTPFFDNFFLLVTQMGDETFFLLIAVYIYWCISKKTGYYLMSVCFTGTVLNQFLKLLFRVPRPWMLDKSFSAVEAAKAGAGGYSFPSGHTQNAFGIFGTLCMTSKGGIKRAVFVAAACLVAFSRMYLGVHTPVDVLTSVATGLALVFVFGRIFENIDKKPRYFYILLAVMLAFAVGYVAFIELYRFPADLDAHNYAEGSKNAYVLLGGIAAMCVAAPLEKRYINFSTKASLPRQIVKTLLGALFIVLIKEIIKEPLTTLFGGHNIAHALRYFTVVIFAVLVWPLTFGFFSKSSKKK